MSEVFLSTRAVARHFRITNAALRYRARTFPGHPQPQRINARVWRWDVRALEAFYSVSFE